MGVVVEVVEVVEVVMEIQVFQYLNCDLHYSIQ